jgi:hypothetical protein
MQESLPGVQQHQQQSMGLRKRHLDASKQNWRQWHSHQRDGGKLSGVDHVRLRQFHYNDPCAGYRRGECADFASSRRDVRYGHVFRAVRLDQRGTAPIFDGHDHGGTWNGSVIGTGYGGTGLSGNFPAHNWLAIIPGPRLRRSRATGVRGSQQRGPKLFNRYDKRLQYLHWHSRGPGDCPIQPATRCLPGAAAELAFRAALRFTTDWAWPQAQPERGRGSAIYRSPARCADST